MNSAITQHIEKICTKCKTPKALEEFSKRTTSIDGLNIYCKLCVKLDKDSKKEETKKYMSMVKLSFYEAVETDIDVRSYREKKITEILN